jgi:hypothetical protein
MGGDVSGKGCKWKVQAIYKKKFVDYFNKAKISLGYGMG